MLHVTFETESAFDTWKNKRGGDYELLGIHYNKDMNAQKPWVATLTKKTNKKEETR